MTRDGTDERSSGGLYRTSGTWYGAPAWQDYQIAQAGTATFTASSAYAGSLNYTVDGPTKHGNASSRLTQVTQRPTLRRPMGSAGKRCTGSSE